MTTKPSSRKPKPSVPPKLSKAASSAKPIKSHAKNRNKATLPASVIPSVVPATPVQASKQAQLIARLHIQPGATISQMMDLTGWQAHTVRGAISGVLRKKMGLNVNCAKLADSGERLYCIARTGSGK